MKTKRVDLEVDFIGGLGSLTKEEEFALSNYFKKKQLDSQKTVQVNRRKSTKRQTTTA
jgi:hypothetical protein